MEKRDEVGLLVRGQSKRMDFLGPARPINAAAIVEVDDGVQRRHRAVVHVGRPARHVAQSRGLEGIMQRHRGREQPAAPESSSRALADVVERCVGEGPAAVTGGAVGFAVEQVEAALGGFADRGFVAVDPAVEWRSVDTMVRSKVASANLDFARRDVAFAECRVESVDIAGDRRQPLDQELSPKDSCWRVT